MKLSNYLSKHGSSKKFAAILGVKQVMVSRWKTGVKPITIRRCYPIEQATNGQVTRKDLRPDDWHLIWPELGVRLPDTNELKTK